MISPHKLDGAFQRIDRAEEHFIELTEHLAAFRQNYLEAAIINFDPDPPYDAHGRHPPGWNPPSIVSILAGEICYNLRSALDYLVFELASHDSGVVQKNTQFPIDDTPQKFARNVQSRLKGVSVAHVAAIEALQPYNGCNWTKALRFLSNPDKHRKLTPQGGALYIEVVRPGPARRVTVATNARTKRQAKRPDGSEMEVELVANLQILIPLARVQGIPVGWPIEEAVENLISEVRNTLETFEPEFQ